MIYFSLDIEEEDESDKKFAKFGYKRNRMRGYGTDSDTEMVTRYNDKHYKKDINMLKPSTRYSSRFPNTIVVASLLYAGTRM